MIAHRSERRGLLAARPTLVVGMAPSRNGADLSDPGSPHPAGKTFARLAAYAGVTEGVMAARLDFVNLLPEWPGEAGGDSEKWDRAAGGRDWAPTGERATLLYADLLERPRITVIGLGGFVRDALAHWWGVKAKGWFDPQAGPGLSVVYWSPHPAGTSMWWNEPVHRELGGAFWADVVNRPSLPRAPQKVPLSTRSRWLMEAVERFKVVGWPEGCVDWPWSDPPGRPQALLNGRTMPAAHVSLALSSGPRPSKEHQALHSCDRGQHCVSGAHLRWGTELENRLDQSARARGAIGSVGLQQATLVRQELEAISARYNVPMDAIARIAGGKSWDPSKWTEQETDGC